MRDGLPITDEEYEVARLALQELEALWKNQKVHKATYTDLKDRLKKDLARPRYPPSNLQTNSTGFFNRDVLDLSARPQGYRKHITKRDITEGWHSRAKPNDVAQAIVNNREDTSYRNDIMDLIYHNHIIRRATTNYERAIHAAIPSFGRSLGAFNKMSYPEIWERISTQPAVVRSLERLANAIKIKTDAAKSMGVHPSVAQEAIIENARRAGEAITHAGYSEERAKEIVDEVMKGELSINGAANLVIGDLGSASASILASSLNYMDDNRPQMRHANSTRLARMATKDILDTKEAAESTLTDPLATEEEIQWAEMFIEDAITALQQRNAPLMNNNQPEETDQTNDAVPLSWETNTPLNAPNRTFEQLIRDISRVDGVAYFTYDPSTFAFTFTGDATPVTHHEDELNRVIGALRSIEQGARLAAQSPSFDANQITVLTQLEAAAQVELALVEAITPIVSNVPLDPGLQNPINNQNNNNSVANLPGINNTGNNNNNVPLDPGLQNPINNQNNNNNVPLDPGLQNAINNQNNNNSNNDLFHEPPNWRPSWWRGKPILERAEEQKAIEEIKKKLPSDNTSWSKVLDDKWIKLSGTKLGASTSSTTSSRTSGAYRFDESFMG